MSTLPENELDLEKLFLPAWAQEDSSSAKYAHYEGEQPRDRRENRRGPRPPRREGGPGTNRPGGRPGAGDRRPRSGGPQEGRPPGDKGQRSGGFQRGPRLERREPPAPLPEVSVSLIPEEKGVESLARQIKMTGRAYPLFDIAQLILQKPERHQIVFSVKKNPEGKVIQPLFVCALDDTLWLSEEEAIAHVLRHHFGTFYQTERTATEPPKGKYTFVAQCGISGVILGPPNYHDYQNQVRKLHTERFSRMPLEVYKSRIKIVRDEEVVKKWVEDQSWKTEFTCLNLPEPLRLSNMDAVEKHFREVHKENIIKPVETHRMTGAAARSLRSSELTRLVRSVTEDQRRFPLQIATVLSQQFASHGLQFFKVNKTITHVAIARPHYLDLELTPVSEGVKQIVDFINSHPKCTRRLLVESLAPTRAAAPPTPAAPVEGAPVADQAPAAATPPPTAAPTPEQTAVIADLHWLIHQGHVIEFANGILECAKKPLPKPPRPEKPKAEPQQPAAATGAEPAATTPDAAPTAEASATPTQPASPETTTPAAASELLAPAAPVQPSDSGVIEAEEKPVQEDAPETSSSPNSAQVAEPEQKEEQPPRAAGESPSTPAA